MKDSDYMRLALKLAKNANPSPNPRVGCIIVKDKKIIGRGYHKKAGTPHAEINAMNNAKNKGHSLVGATMYVTLEPCCIHGRTGPCTKAIKDSGIKKVYAACLDQNPKVAGRGLKILKNAGINSSYGNLEKEAIELNEKFFKYIKSKTPFVLLKAGLSKNWKTAYSKKNKKWITSIASRKKAHELRAEYDAILVGINTVIEDNPRLNCRHAKKRLRRDPIRVILDSHLKIPVESKILANNNVIIFTTYKCDKIKKEILEKKGYSIVQQKILDIKKVILELGKRDITSVLIEGGNKIYDSALSAGVVDKVCLFISPNAIEGTDFCMKKEKLLKKLKQITRQRSGSDMMISGYIR